MIVQTQQLLRQTGPSTIFSYFRYVTASKVTSHFCKQQHLMPGIWLHITVLTWKSYHRIKPKNCLELQAGYKAVQKILSL